MKYTARAFQPCYAVNIMQICPPDPALYAPKSSCPRFLLQFLLRCKCHAIQTTTFCPKYARVTADPGARHPSLKKKKLDDIGLYWPTLDDMSRRILPKREDFASSGQRSQTTAMAGLQTRQSCHQRRHEPGQFCQVENVESLGLTRATAWKLEGARLKPSAFTRRLQGCGD